MLKFLNFVNSITNKQAISIVLILACFLAINSFIVLNHNKFYSYLSEDVVSIVDMSTSFVQEYKIVNGIQNKLFYETVYLIETYWKPPAFFIFSLPFFMFITNINIFIIFLNLIISFITLLSVYEIVRRISSIKIGLLSSYILAFMPLFFVIHRTFFIESFLIAMISLSMAIISINKFDDLKFNIFFTIILIIAMLTKEQIFIYIPTFLFLIFTSQRNYKNISNLINILLIFAFSFSVSYLLWYYLNAPNIFAHLLKYSKEVLNTDYLYYLKSFYYFDVSPFISLIFIMSSMFLVFKKKHISFIICFIFIIVIFSLSGNKVSRHIAPAIIFCPIIISLCVFDIKYKYIRKILICLILIVLPIQYFIINYFPAKMINFNYGYNYFRGVTFYDYVSSLQTYKQQYEYLEKMLGKNFEVKTAFIQFFPSIAYNFLLLQENRKSKICKIFLYDDVENIKNNIIKYDNIIISDRNKFVFNDFEKFLFENLFEKKQEISIYNHDNNKVWLYNRKN